MDLRVFKAGVTSRVVVHRMLTGFNKLQQEKHLTLEFQKTMKTIIK